LEINTQFFIRPVSEASVESSSIKSPKWRSIIKSSFVVSKTATTAETSTIESASPSAAKGSEIAALHVIRAVFAAVVELPPLFVLIFKLLRSINFFKLLWPIEILC